MRSGTFERSLPRYGVTEATALLLRRFICSAAKPNGMPLAMLCSINIISYLIWWRSREREGNGIGHSFSSVRCRWRLILDTSTRVNGRIRRSYAMVMGTRSSRVSPINTLWGLFYSLGPHSISYLNRSISLHNFKLLLLPYNYSSTTYAVLIISLFNIYFTYFIYLYLIERLNIIKNNDHKIKKNLKIIQRRQ